MHHKGHNHENYDELQGKVDHIIKTSGLLENQDYSYWENDELWLDINVVLSDSFDNKSKSVKRGRVNQSPKFYNSVVEEIVLIERVELIPRDYPFISNTETSNFFSTLISLSARLLFFV